MEFQDLLSYKALKELDTNLSSQVDTVYKMVKETINGISGCFDNFTMHDIGHSIRVANYMEQLAFGIDTNQDKRLNEFNAIELTILLLSALLHDIGMFIRPIDRQEITSNNIKYADKLKITYNGVLEVKNGNADEAIKEIIRLTHAARISEFLDYEFDGHQTISQILKIDGNYDYANDIRLVCQAHGEDYNFIKSQLRTSITKGIYEYNLQYFAVLLRIADYLDLDKQRTPMLWFSLMDINGFSKSEWETHFQISNEKKLKQYSENKMQIYFDGISSDARIHRKYLKYIDNLREEIENADILLNSHDANPKYRLNIITRIDNLVQTNGFEYSDLRLSLDYAAITDLLMGKNIYGDYRLGLRELIQNAIDACKLIREIDNELDERPETKISIIISQKNNYVKIRDTGIGMTLDVIKNHFLNIGKSYYKSNEYLYNNYKYKPIGQYGIGFLACFLLSDNVVVKTKYYNSNDVYQIELEKHSEYVVTNTEHSPIFTGTEIRLDYKQFFTIFNSIDDLKNFIETYFNTDIPIVIKDEDNIITYSTENKIIKDIEYIVTHDNKSDIKKIDISKYSNKAAGILVLKPLQKKYNYAPRKIDDIIYLYDQKSKSFKPEKTLENKFYIEIDYANINEAEYSAITKSKRGNERKVKEILALGNTKNSSYKLYIDKNEKFPYKPYYWENKSELIDELTQIMHNSNLPFYLELFGTENLKLVYSYNNNVVQTNNLNYRGDSVYPRMYLETQRRRPAKLYYKNILVRDFRYVYAQLPYNFELFGLIDYLGTDLKLDVSRNEIIEGYSKINLEFNVILLNYFISIEESNDKKDLLKSMLTFITSNS